jgi:hypothetical protein
MNGKGRDRKTSEGSALWLLSCSVCPYSELSNLTTWAKSSYTTVKSTIVVHSTSTLYRPLLRHVGHFITLCMCKGTQGTARDLGKKYTRYLKPFIFEQAKPQCTNPWMRQVSLQQCHKLVSEKHLRRQTERVGTQETIQPVLMCTQESIQKILCMAMAPCTYTVTVHSY